jgi:pyruvate,water dikinase
LSKEIEYWLNFTDEYNKMHDLRKEMQIKTTYSFYLLMFEVARRLKLKKDDLEWLWYEEIKDLLRGGKLDKKEVKRREKAICVRVSKKGIKTYSGKEALKQHRKELKIGKKKVKEIKGLGVSLGKAKAKVKVCSGAKEALTKVKKGDILVCGMTLPDYVPAMKKSSAIITDEGGITCHAAIISRELEIPCIVGTRIATKVLKDGDLVEVDAEKGIVKII